MITLADVNIKEIGLQLDHNIVEKNQSILFLLIKSLPMTDYKSTYVINFKTYTCVNIKTINIEFWLKTKSPIWKEN